MVIAPIVSGSQSYSWIPVMPTLITGSGGGIKVKNEHWLGRVLANHNKDKTVRWLAHTNQSLSELSKESQQQIIATNLTDNPIAWEMSRSNGKVILLPFLDLKERAEANFLRELLDKVKGRLKVSEITQIPSWVSKQVYSFDREAIIDSETQKLRGEKDMLMKAKSILWLDGEELTNSVFFALSQLDIQSKDLEHQGKHDIEILEEGLHAIIEVKGLKGYADVWDLRQLQDWYGEKIKEDENVKGIFLINDFKELEPQLRPTKSREELKDRDYPFTKEAERIAKNNGFCLMTTYQLYLLFRKKLEGSYNKQELLKKIKGTTGFLQL